MNKNRTPKVTRVLNGWYTIGGCLTGLEIIRDAGIWTVRKDNEVVCMAENFDSAKAIAFGMVA